MKLLLGILLFFTAHIITFFQLNGQFKWEWFVRNEWVLALMGVPISFLYIWATKATVGGLDGLLWPARFIGFGVGMIVYAVLVSYYFNEGITLKTFISLLLVTTLVFIQVMMKN